LSPNDVPSPLVANPLVAILGGDPHRPRPFPETSRYAAVETATLQDDDGKAIVYLRRRFVPSPDRFATVREVVVAQGDRLDNLTAKYLGDPEQFWQVCDANGVLVPEDLEAVGRRVRITLPVDVPGPARA
jgi:hypothetical protein